MAWRQRSNAVDEHGDVEQHTENVPVPVRHRTAAPARELMVLTPRTGLLASALSTATVLGTADMHPGVGIAGAAVLTAAIGGKIGGRTAGQWMSLRRTRRRTPEQAALFSRDGVGVIFDGHTATALVEITPRPWQVTHVGATGTSQSPVISADVLRRQLHQFDIALSRIDIICAGYKFASRDNAAGVLDTLIGPVSVPLGGTTVIAVSLDLDAGILGPAYSRARRRSLPDGLCQTLTIAGTRVCHALAEQGFGGRLMNAHQIRDFHDSVLAQVSRPLADPRWRHCGAASGVHTRTYTPARGHWNAESAGSWNHLQSHRQYTSLTLTPQGSGQALAQPLITYLVRGGDALSKAQSYGLRSATGQQAVGLTRSLPVSKQLPLRSAGVLIDDSRRLGFGVPAGGAGMFIGSRADKTRVFVAVSPAEEPLWLAGPSLFALQMVARLATQDQRICVMIDEPAWQRLVAHRNTPALTLGGIETDPADVVVCTPSWWERHRPLTVGKAVLLVAEGSPGRGATNSLAVESVGDHSEIVVTADTQTTRVLWELTPMERRMLLGDDVDSEGGARPSEGVDLRLGQVVALPGAETQPRGRRNPRSPAPVVPTSGMADPSAVPPRRVRPPARPATAAEPLTPPRSSTVQPPAGVMPRPAPPRTPRTPRPPTPPGPGVPPLPQVELPNPRQDVTPPVGRHHRGGERGPQGAR